MIGGGGEKKTLRLVARYADACNLFGTRPGRGARTSSTCCAATATTEGRDYDTIEKTVRSPPGVAGRRRRVPGRGGRVRARSGVTEVQVMPDRHPVEFAQRLGDEVLPRLADIG